MRRAELREAMEKGDPTRVAELLRSGASLTFDDHGLTALHHAVRLNQPDIAKLLLDNGATQYILLGTTWPHVGSPLFLAVKGGNAEMVTLLVTYAARRIERESGLGHRPLSALRDRPVAGTGDRAARGLWQAHLERVARSARRLRVGVPSPGLPRRDPLGVRGGV